MRIEVSDEVKSLLTIVFLTVLCLGLIFLLGSLIGYASCSEATAQIGYPHKYTSFGGCLIQIKPDQWIPLGNLGVGAN